MDGFGSLLIIQILLFVGLDRRRVLCLLVYCPLYYSEGTCTDLQAQLEVFDNQRLFLGEVFPAFLNIVDEGFKPRPLTSVFSRMVLRHEVHAIILSSIFGSLMRPRLKVTILDRVHWFIILSLTSDGCFPLAHHRAIAHFGGLGLYSFVSG